MPNTCLSVVVAALGLAPHAAHSAPRAESAPLATAADDTAELRAMLERLVEELLSASPEFAKKAGPVDVILYDASDVNAFATRDAEGRGKLIVVTGIIEAFDSDERLLRGVIAHELAHLIRGHVLELDEPASPLMNFADVRFHFVRQVEFDADRFGARLLTEAGFSPKDLEDALLRLHDVNRRYGVTWLQSISSDHGSWLERVARIAPSDTRLESLRAFERGLAFIECRRPTPARLAFEYAFELEPAFDEARYGAVRARMQEYYDRLPAALRDEWLRPDFGPQLTLDDVLQFRGVSATDADRRRWEELRAAIAELPSAVAPGLYQHLLGTADVLHPDGDEVIVSAGVQRLQGGMLDPRIARRNRAVLRLALANNAALGLLRLGDEEAARSLLLAELEDNLFDARYLTIANAARLTEIAVTGAYGEVFVATLKRLLRSSRAGSKRYESARSALLKIGDSIGADLLEEEPPSTLQLCRPTELVVGDARLGLFTSLDDAARSLGAPPVDDQIHPDYDTFRVQAWLDDGDRPDIVALVEDGRALKLTTYRPGSAVLLEPADESDLRKLRIEIGSTEAELVRLVSNLDLAWPPIQGVPLLDRSLRGDRTTAAEEEAWIYLPDLALGVLLDEGVVRGLTMTSVHR